MYTHAFLTWFLSNFIVTLLILFSASGSLIFSTDLVGPFFAVLFFSSLFSSPCLLPAFLLIKFIIRYLDKFEAQFFAWLILLTATAFGYSLLLNLWLLNELRMSELIWKPAIAVGITILLRLGYFRLMHDHYTKIKLVSHEDSIE